MRTNTLMCALGFVLCLTCISIVSSEADNQEKATFHFDKESYVNPRIIRDMTTWISDSGDQVVAVDILGSQNSNRYFCHPEKLTFDDQTFISFKNDQETFGYRYIGKTSSGIDVLQTISMGTGSGIFHTLLFVKMQNDTSLSFDSDKTVARFTHKRQILKKFGSIPLGDRFEGSLEVNGNLLYILRHKNNQNKDSVETSIIEIRPGF